MPTWCGRLTSPLTTYLISPIAFDGIFNVRHLSGTLSCPQLKLNRTGGSYLPR